MGRARYISGGEEGRYTIEIDQGSEEKDANLAVLNRRISQLDTNIALQQAENANGQVIVNQIRAAYAIAVDQYIAALNETRGDPEAELPPSDDITEILGILRNAESQLGIANAKLAAWKLEREECRRQVARWNEFQAIETRNAWCADYTEEPEFSDIDLATIEVEGEPGLILVAPGAPPAINADGYLAAREVQRGHQVYYNAALLPGWQKWKPTYRTGVITGINFEAETCTVALDEAASTSQGLDINQAQTLEEVPIVYMDCNAAAFDISDRVVVKFVGQDWGNPRVIGFVDTPQECGPFRPTGFFYAYDFIPFEGAPRSRGTVAFFTITGKLGRDILQDARFNNGNGYQWRVNNQVLALDDFASLFAIWRLREYGVDGESPNVPTLEVYLRDFGTDCGKPTIQVDSLQQRAGSTLTVELRKLGEGARTLALFDFTQPIYGKDDYESIFEHPSYGAGLELCSFPSPLISGQFATVLGGGIVATKDVSWVEVSKV